MLWPADGAKENSAKFGSFEADDVLYEMDGPKLFTVKGSDGIYLVYESTFDPRDRLTRYIAVLASEDIIAHLLDGTLTLREALDQTAVWSIDQFFDGSLGTTLRLAKGLSSVPDGYKPEAGVRLQADHHYAS